MKRKMLFVIVLILIGIGSYFAYGNYFSKIDNNPQVSSGVITYGNSSGNLSNGGYVTRYNDYLYGDINPSGQGLYRSSLKFKNLYRLTDDQALFVNTDGIWVYYLNYSDNMSIYKVNVNGGGKVKLSSDKADSLNMVNGILYYIDVSKKRSIHSMTTDGNNKKTIISDTNCMNLIVKDGYIFYSVKNNIYRIDEDGKNRVKLAVVRTQSYELNDAWKGNFDVKDGYLYYPGSDGNLYAIDINGNKSILVMTGNVESINIYSNYLYYYSNTTKTIYRIKLSDKPKQEYIFGGANYSNLIIVNNDGVMFKDKSVVNGGIFMVEKKL